MGFCRHRNVLKKYLKTFANSFSQKSNKLKKKGNKNATSQPTQKETIIKTLRLFKIIDNSDNAKLKNVQINLVN